MEKEFIRETQNSVTLNVTAGKIDSFRQIERTTGTVRVYENDCIGVAGCLGEPDEAELTARAKEALSFGIPYPCKLEGALEKEELHEEEIIPVSEFIPVMQGFLDRLGERCPKFALSNKIMLSYGKTEYRNSMGRRLASSGRSLSVELIAQNRGSGNLFDTFLGWSGERFDEEALLKQFGKEYDAFYTAADIEPGRYPVVFEPFTLFSSFQQHFVGDLYAAGASLLSGKLGSRVFSEKLTVKDDMNPKTSYGCCFFDTEGCTVPDMRPSFVENGVFKGVLTTKKTAELYGLPNLGTASAAYDGVPDIGFHGLYLEPTAGSLRELVPGRAVCVVVAAGGDATPDGHYATPVQMAYLMENGELVGRLPNINVSGGFFELFGRDYLGAVRDDPLKGSMLSACMMDVSKA
jgi:PmbA protein